MNKAEANLMCQDHKSDAYRFYHDDIGSNLTKAELKAAKPAPTIKNEWVWQCPFCNTRNYYLGQWCKLSGCITKRLVFKGGGWYAVPYQGTGKLNNNPPVAPPATAEEAHHIDITEATKVVKQRKSKISPPPDRVKD